ncbi:hypothetical protein [Bartonella sp. AP58NXGY]|uniref:hypothetical protein n=1 Tax=Bartonella sp. AP58NXGY TaxID=3243498 RepID=UPI0035CF5B70
MISFKVWTKITEKKYELTDETIEVAGKTLYRIRALKDFRNIKKGDLGSFMQYEGNLSPMSVIVGFLVMPHNSHISAVSNHTNNF